MSKKTVVSTLFFCLLAYISNAHGTPSNDPDVLRRRGSTTLGSGPESPSIKLEKPQGGWTSALQVEISGTCSDPTSDPITVNINGIRYYIRSSQGDGGKFKKIFPLSPGRNTVVAECANAHGLASDSISFEAAIPPIPLKVVLTSDTDGVYTDLHVYEPKGEHVYWGDTHSPSGGIFYLNQTEGSFDQPGYGPYLYVHPAPISGVYRVDANYWPGQAVQHTLANLDVTIDEGLSTEYRRRVQKPLARPGETSTLAYIVIRGRGLSPSIYVPSIDSPATMPKEVRDFKNVIEPKINEPKDSDDSDSPESEETDNNESEQSGLNIDSSDERALRESAAVIALAQANHLSPTWQKSQQDCAGLVRFAYREALRARSTRQLKRLEISSRIYLPTVSPTLRNRYPTFPAIWITAFDNDGAPVFGNFADAETLISYNFVLESRDFEQAKLGDILVFRKELESLSPYHLMLYAPGPSGKYVVYHNGGQNNEGQVRVVRADDLFSSPDPSWRPNRNNPFFLGVYKWKGLQQAL